MYPIPPVELFITTLFLFWNGEEIHITYLHSLLLLIILVWLLPYTVVFAIYLTEPVPSFIYCCTVLSWWQDIPRLGIIFGYVRRHGCWFCFQLCFVLFCFVATQRNWVVVHFCITTSLINYLYRATILWCIILYCYIYPIVLSLLFSIHYT